MKWVIEFYFYNYSLRLQFIGDCANIFFLPKRLKTITTHSFLRLGLFLLFYSLNNVYAPSLKYVGTSG